MKEYALSMWKWILISGLLLAVGVLLLLGMGRKRGTRTYRWRMALWSLALTLLGGGVILSAGCAGEGREKTGSDTLQPTCYAMRIDAVVTPDGEDQPDFRVSCYAMRIDAVVTPDGENQPDFGVSCYVADIPRRKPEEVRVMCYEDVQVMCYEPVFDAGSKPDVEGKDEYHPPTDITVTCYAPLLPDAFEGEDQVGQKEDIPVMCYDPAINLDIVEEDAEEKPDVPQPTCYAPPAPEE